MIVRLTPLNVSYHRSRRPPIPPHRPVFSVVLMLLGIAVIIAFIMDARRLANAPENPMASADTVQAMLIDVTTTTNRFRDEHRAFSIAIPEGWTLATGEEANPFDFVFQGPNLMALSIQVTDVPHETIDDLVGHLRQIENEQGVHTHIEVITYRGFQAVRRQSHLTRIDMQMLDVLAKGREYHLQFKIPSDIGEAYRPAIEAILNSFEPM